MWDQERQTPEEQQPEEAAAEERTGEEAPQEPEEGAEILEGGEEETSKDQRSDSNPLFDWVSAVVSAVLTVVLLFTFAAQLISVDGASMQSTLFHGDRLVVLNRSFCTFQAGDVVIVQDYNAPLDGRIVKRIIATGGQTVDIDFLFGTVYVDGQALEEPYIKEPTYTSEGISFPLTLGENEVFLMGDNRNHSTDSRSIQLGPVDQRYIVGKAVLLLFPGETPETGEIDWGRLGLIR